MIAACNPLKIKQRSWLPRDCADVRAGRDTFQEGNSRLENKKCTAVISAATPFIKKTDKTHTVPIGFCLIVITHTYVNKQTSPDTSVCDGTRQALPSGINTWPRKKNTVQLDMTVSTEYRGLLHCCCTI